MSLPRRLPTTLVAGASARARDMAIAGLLDPSLSCAVILEGLASGHTILSPNASVQVQRIASGCLCCTGNLVLRVTLNRILRSRPERLFIGLAAPEHLDQLRSWLLEPPYDQLLELTLDRIP